MNMSNQVLRARVSQGDKALSLELHLSRHVFARGRQLSGVVLLRLMRPIDIKSLVVSVEGGEYVAGSKLPGSSQPAGVFFRRDVVLSGRDRPRFIADRLSQYWNAFLKREQYRTLSLGEHTYPFILPLPGSLPPSCEAKAGRIAYRVTARLKFPLGRALHVSVEVPVAFANEDSEPEPFSLSHSSVYGGKHATGADLTLALPGRSFVLNAPLEGRLILSNPRCLPMGQVTIDLAVFEGLRTSNRVGTETRIGTTSFVFDDPTALQASTDFHLDVPADAPVSVEGAALLVTWSLNVTVEAGPPLELRVPIIVSRPVV